MRSYPVDGILWSVHDSGGEGLPAIVFLHGFTGSAAVWEDVTVPFAPSCRCIAPDLPGHGATVGPHREEDLTMGSAASGLSGVCDAMGLTNVTVWGYSMGGRLALHWALQDQSRVSALILESCSPGIEDEDERSARRASDAQLAARITETGVPAFTEEWIALPLFATQRNLPPEKRERGRRIRESNTAAGLAMSLRRMGAGTQAPLHERLASLTMPVLVLCGDRDEKYCAIGDRMSAVIPGASFRIVSGAGHAVSWENPGAAVEIARGFLERAAPDSRS